MNRDLLPLPSIRKHAEWPRGQACAFHSVLVELQTTFINNITEWVFIWSVLNSCYTYARLTNQASKKSEAGGRLYWITKKKTPPCRTDVGAVGLFASQVTREKPSVTGIMSKNNARAKVKAAHRRRDSVSSMKVRTTVHPRRIFAAPSRCRSVVAPLPELGRSKTGARRQAAQTRACRAQKVRCASYLRGRKAEARRASVAPKQTTLKQPR